MLFLLCGRDFTAWFSFEVIGLENPVFKLEKVLRSKSVEEMQDFEGPLDLILFLLGKNKMEIQDISISLICDQYMIWLEQRQKMDLDVASEFVTMASHLVYIKTRMLLSIEDAEAQSEMDALIQSLEERRRNESYARMKSLAEKLSPMGEFGRNILTRNPEPVERGKIYEYSQDPGDLILAMAEIQNRAERTLPPPKTAFQDIVQHEPYPVENKAREIIQRLKQHGITSFRLLFRGNRSRSEVVATFLAVLELCRARILHLAGSETDCTVRQERELPENLTL
ncbi:segregation/condensation protein A [Oscillibacter sp. PC13]|jgi:segregation and condensation protein A|uniref:segregation and condensation protein A n=1 Tax=Oscillibacter sp. PC13 TaxID=1855299 RepID=UPI001FA85202|nr:segregation/condensation protein A [Oscillibacter sp. PC13]